MTKMFNSYEQAINFIKNSGCRLPKPYRRIIWVSGAATTVWAVTLRLQAA